MALKPQEQNLLAVFLLCFGVGFWVLGLAVPVNPVRIPYNQPVTISTSAGPATMNNEDIVEVSPKQPSPSEWPVANSEKNRISSLHDGLYLYAEHVQNTGIGRDIVLIDENGVVFKIKDFTLSKELAFHDINLVKTDDPKYCAVKQRLTMRQK